jgi:hypothetical protein
MPGNCQLCAVLESRITRQLLVHRAHDGYVPPLARQPQRRDGSKALRLRPREESRRSGVQLAADRLPQCRLRLFPLFRHDRRPQELDGLGSLHALNRIPYPAEAGRCRSGAGIGQGKVDGSPIGHFGLRERLRSSEETPRHKPVRSAGQWRMNNVKKTGLTTCPPETEGRKAN